MPRAKMEIERDMRKPDHFPQGRPDEAGRDRLNGNGILHLHGMSTQLHVEGEPDHREDQKPYENGQLLVRPSGGQGVAKDGDEPANEGVEGGIQGDSQEPSGGEGSEGGSELGRSTRLKTSHSGIGVAVGEAIRLFPGITSIELTSILETDFPGIDERGVCAALASLSRKNLLERWLVENPRKRRSAKSRIFAYRWIGIRSPEDELKSKGYRYDPEVKSRCKLGKRYNRTMETTKERIPLSHEQYPIVVERALDIIKEAGGMPVRVRDLAIQVAPVSQSVDPLLLSRSIQAYSRNVSHSSPARWRPLFQTGLGEDALFQWSPDCDPPAEEPDDMTLALVAEVEANTSAAIEEARESRYADNPTVSAKPDARIIGVEMKLATTRTMAEIMGIFAKLETEIGEPITEIRFNVDTAVVVD